MGEDALADRLASRMRGKMLRRGKAPKVEVNAGETVVYDLDAPHTLNERNTK